MPELPEVETVRRGLLALLGDGARIAAAEALRRDLREPIPRRLLARLAGQPLTGLRRRAKYLLWDSPAGSLLNHLGMTGNWRLLDGPLRRHDHFVLHLADGRRLAFNDPRRFGLIGFVPPGGRHPALDGLGPEPLEDAFDAAHLAACCRGRRGAIKALIMDQACVVGVGNIYAQEACFHAGIRPTRRAGSLTRAEIAALLREIRRILAQAIELGGSSIDDFRHVNGASGRFQSSFAVYGRAGAACPACQAILRGKAIAGRSSAWCPRCQV